MRLLVPTVSVGSYEVLGPRVRELMAIDRQQGRLTELSSSPVVGALIVTKVFAES